jgi:hypothetical protein
MSEKVRVGWGISIYHEPGVKQTLVVLVLHLDFRLEWKSCQAQGNLYSFTLTYESRIYHHKALS